MPCSDKQQTTACLREVCSLWDKDRASVVTCTLSIYIRAFSGFLNHCQDKYSNLPQYPPADCLLKPNTLQILFSLTARLKHQMMIHEYQTTTPQWWINTTTQKSGFCSHFSKKTPREKSVKIRINVLISGPVFGRCWIFSPLFLKDMSFRYC